jgi:subtilase family serine protease
MAHCIRPNRLFVTLWIAASVALGLDAQTPQSGRMARPLIVDRIDEARLDTLKGNTRPEANIRNDAGAAPGDLAMDHMLLLMGRGSEQAQSLQQTIDQLHDPQSPNFHKWLTAAQFGQMYGAAERDIDTVTAWLRTHGFVVDSVYPSGLVIDFSGTAAQVSDAFHTQIHYLNVNGQRHVANMSDPQIPAALAPAVSGIVSLHDFSPRAMRQPHADFTFASQGSTYQAVTPQDLATIYDFTPLFQAGITGQGQTIAVIEDANLYSTSDWDTFRSAFGLTQYTSGSLTTVHPAPASGGNNCGNPGLGAGDDSEAILDAEWASAAAPDAAIEVTSCASTRTTFGGLIALENLINSANPPAVVSISYGECEAGNGAASNAAYALAYEQAVAEGISVFVAAGDDGAASCDDGASGATHGIGVSAFASTPYNVAVGGTDFSDSYDGVNSTYWNSANSAAFGSALFYIPEIPWNDSCGSFLLASYLNYASPYGASGLCSSTLAQQQGLLAVAAGSGGPSGCATGIPATAGVTDGTCQGYAKPSWQSGVTGIPADGVRDIPDVSMFAGTGVWGHYYVMCWSDIRNGGASCAGDPSTWTGAGGTSFGAPIVAGIQALINQSAGGSQGNPNYVYYNLAASGAPVFHGVTRGDITVNCSGTEDCYGASSSSGGRGRRGSQGSQSPNGALSVSSSSYDPAYGAANGWNFATGNGSIDAYNLVTNWSSGQ